MQDFDHALKAIFQTVGTSLIARLGGAPPREFLNVELAHTRAPRADLVSWLWNGGLFHLEFQGDNDAWMAWRMLEYYALLRQLYGVEPRQVVLYVGRQPLRMPAGLDGVYLHFRYEAIDIRTFDAEELLASPLPGDHILAILCRTTEPKARIRRILERLLPLPPDELQRALRLLLLLSGMRDLREQIKEEVAAMPVIIDPMKVPYVEDFYKKGLSEGEIKGRSKGQIALLKKALEARFGTVSPALNDRLQKATEDEIERWILHLMSGGRPDELFS